MTGTGWAWYLLVGLRAAGAAARYCGTTLPPHMFAGDFLGHVRDCRPASLPAREAGRSEWWAFYMARQVAGVHDDGLRRLLVENERDAHPSPVKIRMANGMTMCGGRLMVSRDRGAWDDGVMLEPVPW